MEINDAGINDQPTPEARVLETTPIVVKKHGRKYCAQFKAWYLDTPQRQVMASIWGDSEDEVNQKVKKFLAD